MYNQVYVWKLINPCCKRFCGLYYPLRGILAKKHNSYSLIGSLHKTCYEESTGRELRG